MRTERRLLLLGALATAVPLRASPLPELMARAKPAVVLVGVFNPTAAPRFSFRGTGFAIGDGLTLVTNDRVLPERGSLPPEAKLMVQVWRGGRLWEGREARVLRRSREVDLALLRVDGTALPALPLAEDSVAREGADVALIGFPIGGTLGFSHVVHRGVLSAITGLVMAQGDPRGLTPRAVRALRDGAFEIYQLDITAYPGNSGGPVLDLASGQVIAVINSVFIKGARESALSDPTGISYAIPVHRLRALLQEGEGAASR